MASVTSGEGIVRFRSAHDVPATIAKLTEVLQSHGITVFARIDFSGDAANVGLSMLPEQMLVFGHPKAGTPLMQAAPILGLDLPLKALVFEDAQGVTWVAYNTPEYLMARHGLPTERGDVLQAGLNLLRQVAA